MNRTRRLAGWALVVLVLGVWWSFRPTWLGGSSSFLVVNGHSMDGTYATGDFVVVKPRSSYAPGEIVGFRVPADQPGAGMVVIHRVVDVAADGRLQTQGDNNADPDPWTISPTDVEGTARLRLPRLGEAFTSMRSPLALAAVAGLLAAWTALGDEDRDRRVARRPRRAAEVQ